ncbi:MAG: glycosyltransferase, partial [Pseudomonadota bacterium]
PYTTLRSGNATSTLDEFNLVKKRGLKVKLVHCPTPRSAWRPVSDRYNSCRSDIHHWHEINKINAPVIIVRQPVAACSLGFGQLMSSLHADVIYFEVNNSKFRASGEPTYDPATLEKRIASLNIPRKIIVPIGPAIRRELYSSFNDHSLISDRDWNPTFDIGQFSGAAKQTMVVPYKIGRHGRDAPEKWLESKEDLLSAYPDDPQFDIRILGGANAARKTLGELPANWRVTGFGGMEANAFLAELDVFVYFPSAGLNEAFGRTVMEAMFAGRPCILPDRFRETFGEMAFYGSPADVQRFVSRIAERNEDRMNFVDEVTNFAINNYSFEALNKRFDDMLNTNMKDPGASSEQVVGINAFLSERARSFKFWVES